ncbi:MAG: helix-turn-helix transcriptional regulator [Fluviicola sp.]|jgi:DNA-binding transcriptional ArsR family regulator|nr:helix-turn-helix transcriptional regulator [Fluviicola sp.]
MGSTKKLQYNKNQLFKAKIAKAIGHPARVSILEYLVIYGFVKNRDLVPLLKLNGSTIVQHLQVLENAGLIKEEFIMNEHMYFLKSDAMKKCGELITIFNPH